MTEQTFEEYEPQPRFGVDYLHPCALHVMELEIDPTGENGENWPGCPECGCMLDTESCPWCGSEWLLFGDWSADDVLRPAGLTMSGDLMCANCAKRTDEEEENPDEYSGDWEDDYP